MRTFDEGYLRGLAARDPQVENDLIACFTSPVKSKLRNYFRSSYSIEDAYQETLLRVFAYFRGGKTLRSPSRLPAFILAICGNVALEMIRAGKRDISQSEDVPDVIDSSADPENRVLASESRSTLRRILSELDEKDRVLIRRVCLEEEERDKICQEFNITRDYLRILLHRARLRFRALLVQAYSAGVLQAGNLGCHPGSGVVARFS